MPPGRAMRGKRDPLHRILRPNGETMAPAELDRAIADSAIIERPSEGIPQQIEVAAQQ